MSRHNMLQQYDQAARDHIVKHRNLQRRYEHIFKADEPDADADEDEDEDETDNSDNGDSGDSEQRHVIDQLADWLVEAGDGEVSRESALNWLLHDERGQALIRMAQHRKRATRKDFQMTRSETLRSMVKRHNGIAGLCQHIVAKGSSGDIPEAELTGMITAAAKAEHPDMDDARAFTKAFTGPNGEVLRRATQIAMFTGLYGR